MENRPGDGSAADSGMACARTAGNGGSAQNPDFSALQTAPVEEYQAYPSRVVHFRNCLGLMRIHLCDPTCWSIDPNEVRNLAWFLNKEFRGEDPSAPLGVGYVFTLSNLEYDEGRWRCGHHGRPDERPLPGVPPKVRFERGCWKDVGIYAQANLTGFARSGSRNILSRVPDPAGTTSALRASNT